MLSSPSHYKSRNPYLVKFDGKTAVFRTPLRRTILALFLSVPCFAIGLAPTVMAVESAERWGFQWINLVLALLFGTPGLLLGISAALSSGATKITFDLQRRAYRQVILRPPPLLMKRYPDTTGWGNPLLRRVVHGQMSDLEGIQVVEREDNSQRIYSVYVVPKNPSASPCVVYYSTSLQDAQEQAQEIRTLIGLPALKTMLMDDPDSLGADAPGTTRPSHNSNASAEASLTLLNKGFCTMYTPEKVAFATPKKYRIFQFVMIASFLAFAAGSFSLAIHCTIYPDPKVHPAEVYCIAALWLLPATISITNTGINRITFDLADHTYERTFHGPPILGGAVKSLGPGNRFQRMAASGPMEDIAGVEILSGTGGKNNTKYYGVQLQWKNGTQPPMGVGFSLDRREAREQAAKIAELLSLPFLGIDEKPQPYLYRAN